MAYLLLFQRDAMITTEEFKVIRDAFRYYDEQLVNKIYIFTYRHRDTKKLHTLSLQFLPGNFMHLCGVQYKGKARDFYKDLKRSKIRLKDVKYNKRDGTSELKINALPNLPLLFKKGMRVTDGGQFLNMQFTNAIRTGKDILAIACIQNGSILAPLSLLNLNTSSMKNNTATFRKSHSVEKLEIRDIHTQSITVAFSNI